MLNPHRSHAWSAVAGSAAALLLALAPTRPLAADDPHARCRELAAQAAGSAQPAGAVAVAPGGPAPSGQVAVEVVDADLLDQDGRALRFAADAVGDRLVVVNFVYTTCTTVCPILSAKLARLQALLGDRLGREVRLVSISIDPRRDTPARLKAYAARHGAGPGWLHLTGRPEEVERVVRGLGAWSPSLADHAPITLVGAGRAGRWLRLNGFPSPEQVLARLDELAAGRRLDAGAAAAPGDGPVASPVSSPVSSPFASAERP